MHRQLGSTFHQLPNITLREVGLALHPITALLQSVVLVVGEVVQVQTQPVFWLTARTASLERVVVVVIGALAGQVLYSLNMPQQSRMRFRMMPTLRRLVRRRLLVHIQRVVLLTPWHPTLEH